MKSAQLQWHIHWPSTVFALALLPLLLTLGIWQLHRADEKRIAQTALEQRAEESPTDLEQLTDEPDTYTRVQVRGHFDNGHNFLLDNRVRNGRFGYEIVTPFLPTHTSIKLLVDRGWVAGDPARSRRPAIAPVDGEVMIVGSVYRDTTKFNFFKTVHEAQWPKLIQSLRTDDLQEQLAAPIFPYLLHIDANSPGAYAAGWQIYSNGFGPERHIGYAVTWFAMAFTLAITWVLISSNLWQLIQGNSNNGG